MSKNGFTFNPSIIPPLMPLNIISYNVNGIRSALSKGLAEWLAENGPDILCIQETKASPDQVGLLEIEALGYHHYWHSAEKKGYSGVATFSKIKPDKVVEGCGEPRFDSEGRILRTDFGDWTLLNCYFPSGTTGEVRQAVKMEFLDFFYDWVNDLHKERPNLIIVGDYNIAHTAIDIHDPVGNKKSSGFLPEERAWMTKWFANGFTDAFRHKHPDKVEYSWWSFRAGSRGKNKGWRIDYHSVSDNLRDRLLDAGHYNDAVHSDHCPVWMIIDL
jgi:exodeoxyribonuclease III